MLPGLLTALAGLGLGLSLIVAIGAQNAFVLRQGLRRQRVGVVVLVCALSEVVVIAAGVAGAGAVVEAHPRLLDVVRTLRNEQALRFELCLGASGVHFPEDTGRELHVVLPLLSITHNRRVRVETTCPDSDPHVPSVVSVYPTNDWHERETYDFFGIIFDGHPALTRIEMPDDWPGHPQRKDYPLGGIPVEYKGATIPPPDTRRAYN